MIRMLRKGKKRQSPVFSSLKEIDLKSVHTTEEEGPASLEANTISADTPVTEPSPSGIVNIPEEKDDGLQEPITEEQMKQDSRFDDAGVEDIISLFENAFILIHPGTFFMGSTEYEVGRDKGEVLHEVTLTKRFYMQTTPVTQAQWKSVMGSNPSKFIGENDECPVENVTWYDCLDFIKSLNRTSKAVYRLPTEAEWEYACRAGSSESCSEGMIMEFFCGHDPYLDTVGWYCGNSNRRTHPVASKNANEWGLYDMHGNIFEWCQDWYGPYSSEKGIDPLLSLPGPGRVIRGGSWFANAKNCRSAARLYWSPQSKSDFIGFRLVKEAG